MQTQQPEQKTAQVRVKPNNFVMGFNPGTIMWVTPTVARQLHAANCVDLIGTKDGKLLTDDPAAQAKESVVKKSSDAPGSGPSTGSASSNQSGPAKPLSALLAAPVLPQTSAPQLQQPKLPEPPALSQSTTRTKLRLRQTSSTSPTAAGGNGTGNARNSRRSRG